MTTTTDAPEAARFTQQRDAGLRRNARQGRQRDRDEDDARPVEARDGEINAPDVESRRPGRVERLDRAHSRGRAGGGLLGPNRRLFTTPLTCFTPRAIFGRVRISWSSTVPLR